MSLEFLPFYLSDNALLFMYNDDISLGAYSSINNNEENEFSIPLLRGEVIHITPYPPRYTRWK